MKLKGESHSLRYIYYCMYCTVNLYRDFKRNFTYFVITRFDCSSKHIPNAAWLCGVQDMLSRSPSHITKVFSFLLSVFSLSFFICSNCFNLAYFSVVSQNFGNTVHCFYDFHFKLSRNGALALFIIPLSPSRSWYIQLTAYSTLCCPSRILGIHCTPSMTSFFQLFRNRVWVFITYKQK